MAGSTFAQIVGYNIRLKINDKDVLGATQDDLQVTAQTKDSITKDNAGVKQSAVTGQEITFKVAGLIMIESGGTTKLDSDDLLEQSLKTGDSAIIPFKYNRTGGDSYSGNCIMTDYSESTPADPDSDATYSASFKVSGSMTKVTQ